MDAAIDQRRTWKIDQRLAALVGCPIRVRAESIVLKGWNGVPLKHIIDNQNFILPDGTKIERDPVYVEGMLKEFARHVAVVFVELESLPFDGAAEGRVLFRGESAVFLQAPATVQLHPSYFVERLPADTNSYWHHLSAIDPQMRLPWIETG